MDPTTLDPRTPVLVGGGQTDSRDGAREPLGLLVGAARLAGNDAGSVALLTAVQSVRVIGILSWAYPRRRR